MNLIRKNAESLSNGASVETAKRQFLEYIEIERGRAVKTVENYDRYLTRYFAQMGVKSVKDITEQNVRDFRLWLNRQPGTGRDAMKRRTQNYYMIALRAFLKFLRKRDIPAISPEKIELAKLPERHLDLITSAELDRLMRAPREAYAAEKDKDKDKGEGKEEEEEEDEEEEDEDAGT